MAKLFDDDRDVIVIMCVMDFRKLELGIIQQSAFRCGNTGDRVQRILGFDSTLP